MKLIEAVAVFIERKHEAGFVYSTLGVQLRNFGRYGRDVELAEISSSQIANYLDIGQPSTYTWRSKRAQLCDFVSYWSALGMMPALQMPLARALQKTDFLPHIFSRSQIRAMLDNIPRLLSYSTTTYDAETFRCMILLIYGAGIRLSEAVAIRTDGFDLQERKLHVPSVGRLVGRTIPIGLDMVRVLRSYQKWKARRRLEGDFFLLRRSGNQLSIDNIYDYFPRLLRLADVQRSDCLPYRPRIFDLRNTFAVHQIEGWLKKKKDLNKLLPALAAYMGLQDLSRTERYMQFSPERFRGELQKLSPAKGSLQSAYAELETKDPSARYQHRSFEQHRSLRHDVPRLGVQIGNKSNPLLASPRPAR